jgi:hypothetical protein
MLETFCKGKKSKIKKKEKISSGKKRMGKREKRK